jgi:hypothetical protein
MLLAVASSKHVHPESHSNLSSGFQTFPLITQQIEACSVLLSE